MASFKSTMGSTPLIVQPQQGAGDLLQVEAFACAVEQGGSRGPDRVLPLYSAA